MNAVWSTSAMQHFGKTASEALGWPLYIDVPLGDDIENVYIVGMYDPPYYRHTNECVARAKNKVVQWCGSDTRLVDKGNLPDFKQQFASAELYVRNLRERGITDVTELLLPVTVQTEVTPLPEQPTITSYLGGNAAFYGGDYIGLLMDALPDVRFVTYPYGIYSAEQMPDIYANSTLHLQLGGGGGGISMREAMQAGRPCIGTIDYFGVDWFDPYDFETLLARVKKYLERTEPDAELAAYWKEANDPRHFVAAVKGAFE